MEDPKQVKIVVRRPKLASHVVLFTSLSIIILAFFILLNAYSTYEESRVRKALDSINIQFKGVFEKTMALFRRFDNPDQDVQVALGTSRTPGEDLLFAMNEQYYDDYKSLGQFVSQYGLGGKIGLVVTSRGLVISVAEDLSFGPASADLTPAGQAFLDRLIQIIAPYRNEILIEGHTDSGPPPGQNFDSNWELSQARAIAVLRYLRDGGIDVERLSAGGASSFRPVADNQTPEGRSLNRRVDIIIKHPDM